ncbi:protein MODIFYING WALL LIGNIN-1-like isoform X1 [Lycium barbarum]|uniref:protein MODIFYING WALL LIGNIN-1-like isoform X1 n=1 Tax=Lycium barbarum TaxID=112863 RepID=UPI00293E813B|nr:protein MODIFYING WALL LIGNIN-1-like isoform X1 [Lycium barbarum]
MENHHFIYPILISSITALGLVSISLCIAAEFKKTKKKDLRFDGELCYLPGSVDFEFGIGAIICLVMAQVIGNLLICKIFFSRDHQNSSSKAKKKPTINGFMCVLSWISFVMAIILIGTGSSMNKSQPLGEGWIDGECYIVKDGVYIISAILVFVTLSSTLGSLILKIKKKNQVETRWQDTSTS